MVLGFTPWPTANKDSMPWMTLNPGFQDMANSLGAWVMLTEPRVGALVMPDTPHKGLQTRQNLNQELTLGIQIGTISCGNLVLGCTCPSMLIMPSHVMIVFCANSDLTV